MNGHEWLALWYLRLNGYFTTPNFIAHGRPGPLTEVDVLGVRFPHSAEFEDDPRLGIPKDGIDIVFAEAKGNKIEALNGPWGSPQKGALDYVLRRVGVLPREQVKALAADLYKRRNAKIDGFRIRIVCFAGTIGEELLRQGVTFISWAQVLDFVRKRFDVYHQLKQEHKAWDDFGKYLWATVMNPRIDADGLFRGWKKEAAMAEPRTTKPGYVNRNGQVVIRNTGKPGTDHGQTVYQLACSDCGHVYGANGSDIFERRCPKHQDGAPGLAYS